jgi:NADH dehydrogenase
MRIAVTGAFGYSGRYIAEKLLADGHAVIGLTNSPRRSSPLQGRVEPFPFNFDEPATLAKTLCGIEVLVNTYWVRFGQTSFSHGQAVQNTRTLFAAAKAAGVRRIVHISIANPDLDSPLPCYRGKAELEAELRGLGPSYCILRPTVLFGGEDILVNNIAWSLRHTPVFGIFGNGAYRLRPIHVEDLATAAAAGACADRNEVVEAIGPEVFTYRGLVETIRQTLGLRRLVVPVPPLAGYLVCRLLGILLRDVIITRDELRGLMQELLYVDAPALGSTRLSDWVREHRETLGRRYASELARRRDRTAAYQAQNT